MNNDVCIGVTDRPGPSMWGVPTDWGSANISLNFLRIGNLSKGKIPEFNVCILS